MSVFDEVAADIRGREVIGAANHGGRALDAMEPGRDWLREAYEESLDMAVYLRAELSRREAGVGRPEGREGVYECEVCLSTGIVDCLTHCPEELR